MSPGDVPASVVRPKSNGEHSVEKHLRSGAGRAGQVRSQSNQSSGQARDIWPCRVASLLGSASFPVIAGRAPPSSIVIYVPAKVYHILLKPTDAGAFAAIRIDTYALGLTPHYGGRGDDRPTSKSRPSPRIALSAGLLRSPTASRMSASIAAASAAASRARRAASACACRSIL